MENEKRPQPLEYDQEGEKTVQQQIMESYQSGVIDKVDQGKKRTQADEEGSIQ